MVEVKMSMDTAGAIAMLFAAGHDRVCGVPNVGGCTAIPGAAKPIHHICSVMLRFDGSR